MTSRMPYDHERELDLVLERCHGAARDAAIPAADALPEGFTGTLGHFPVYFPEEIAHAAGLLPVNVLGGGNRLEMKHADARMGSFVCSICRSTTELGLNGTLGSMTGFVTHPICDAAKHLAGIWARNFPEQASQILYLPQNVNTPGAVRYIAAEYQRLRRVLETKTGRTVASRGTTTGAVQVVQWWKIFGDPELDSLVERAVQANYDLRIAEGRLREARALRAGAISDFGPTLSASGSYAKQRRSENAPAFTAPTLQLSSDLYDARFDASWEIDVFSGKRRAVEAATAELAAVAEERRDVWLSVLAEVARNYVDVRGLQQRLAVTRKNIRAQFEAVEITRARFNAGLTSELDVKQAEALVATTQAQLPAMQTALKQAVHRLGVLLGQQPGTLIAELSSARPIPAPPPIVAVGLPSDLLRRRPDVRRAERKLAAATANIGVETAELFPKFSLLGSGGLQSVSAGDWLGGGSRYGSVGPTLTWRLLDFGRIRARIKAADARQEQALAAYEKTILSAFEDVENALVAYANEQARFDSLKASVSANRRALELANALYTKGLADFLGVLDAERSLYQAEDQLADSQRTVTQRLVALYKALGGGWEEETRSRQARDAYG